jgi:hypothetical protein
MNMELSTLSSAVPNKLTDLEVTEIADNCELSGSEKFTTTPCGPGARLVAFTINCLERIVVLNLWKHAQNIQGNISTQKD